MATGGYHVPGFVYLAQCGDYFKIGASIEPKTRMYGIRRYGPYPPDAFRVSGWNIKKTQLIHAIPVDNMNKAETILHDHFAGARLGYSEWFLLTDADVEWIKSLQKI